MMSLCAGAFSQSLHIFPSVSGSSLRGLSALSDNILWVSGSGGTVGRSLNGGRFFQWIKVPGYAKTEFRDIEAFSDKEAVIMGITDPAVILKTSDAGKTWKKVFTDTLHSAFFDAMNFSGINGILVGDPTARKPVFATTTDKGDHWSLLASPIMLSDTGEAFFAASGSNILLKPDGRFLCVTGGTRSYLYMSDGQKDSLPLIQGGNSTGANAIAQDPGDSDHYYIAGGDFQRDSLAIGTAVGVHTSPFTYDLPEIFPSGYKSSVCYVDRSRMVACGTSGVDISSDGGRHWQKISTRPFHVCQKSRSGNKVFLAGGNGSIGVISFP